MESPKIRLLNRTFGNILSIFPRKNSKTQSSPQIFFSPGPRKFILNLIFRDWPRSGEFGRFEGNFESQSLAFQVGHLEKTRSQDITAHGYFSNKTKRGREKKGPSDIASKSFSQKGPKWCSVHRSHREKIALEIGQLLRRNSGMISGGPFLSRPLSPKTLPY